MNERTRTELIRRHKEINFLLTCQCVYEKSRDMCPLASRLEFDFDSKVFYSKIDFISFPKLDIYCLFDLSLTTTCETAAQNQTTTDKE